jgi:glycosyltransferase involved in cell wall biosynthesis
VPDRGQPTKKNRLFFVGDIFIQRNDTLANTFGRYIWAMHLGMLIQLLAICADANFTNAMVAQSFPLVSVIIPTHNRRHLIEPAIASVLTQRYPNYELIIVDDASTDGTSAWLKAQYPQIKLIELSDNQGASGARNTGIKAAQGEFIAFLDSDDQWHTEYLAQQVEAIEKVPNAAFVFCNHVEVSQDGKLLKTLKYKPSDQYRDLVHRLLTGVFIFTMSVVVVRRAALQAVGSLDTRLTIAHDRELYIRLLSIGSMAHVDQVLVTRVMHNSNISADYLRWAREVFMIIDIFFSRPSSKAYQDLAPRIRSHWALIIAREVWQRQRNPRIYAQMILKAVIADPGLLWRKVKAKLVKA